jgi:nucleotide-binding universal stress UspA family protein
MKRRVSSDGAVVVATDRSPGSRIALERGRSIGEALGLRLVVVHVVEPDHGEDPNDVADELAIEHPDATVIVREGRAFVELIRASREVGAALIVAGAFGEHRSGPRPFGVTVDRLVRSADRPVLVVRIAPQSEYRIIVCGVDGSVEAEAAMTLALDIAPAARLVAVRAYEPMGVHRLVVNGADPHEIDRYRMTLASIAEEGLERDLNGRRAALEVAEGRPEDVLTRAVRQHDAELLAVGWRGVDPIRHVLLGSVAHHVVYEADCDVLIHRSPAADFEMP